VKPLLLNPNVADLAPDGDELTAYDVEHTVTYIRMLDAEKARADWREVARIVLHIDPEAEGGAPVVLSTATCRARSGFRDGAIDSFWAEARCGNPDYLSDALGSLPA
jgi:hypothetical protein